MGLYEFTGGCNEFTGYEDRQTTGHLPYDGLSRYPMHGFVRADPMVGIVPMIGIPRTRRRYAASNVGQVLRRLPMGLHATTIRPSIQRP